VHAGRKDLFTVLDMQHPARPSDDAWMGNMLVDPARGKAHAAGPEERMGRKDLFDLMQQKILLQAQQGSQSSRVSSTGFYEGMWCDLTHRVPVSRRDVEQAMQHTVNMLLEACMIDACRKTCLPTLVWHISQRTERLFRALVIG